MNYGFNVETTYGNTELKLFYYVFAIWVDHLLVQIDLLHKMDKLFSSSKDAVFSYQWSLLLGACC